MSVMKKDTSKSDDVLDKQVIKTMLVAMSAIVVLILSVAVVYTITIVSVNNKERKENEVPKPVPYNSTEQSVYPYQQYPISLPAATETPEPEPEPPAAEYDWNDLIDMAKAKVGKSDDPSVWMIDPTVPLVAFSHIKGKKMTLWIVNPKKKKYIKRIRLIWEGDGPSYHAIGNKRDRYYAITKIYTLVHEVNGEVRDRYEYLGSINLIPGPDNYRDDDDDEVPEEYSSWEDYYYENSDGIDHYYYGGN